MSPLKKSHRFQLNERLTLDLLVSAALRRKTEKLRVYEDL